MQEAPEDSADITTPDNRRMTWPVAVALLAVASVVCWLVIASVFLGVAFDADTVADDRDLKELLEFAPAAGPSQDEGPAAGTPAPQDK